MNLRDNRTMQAWVRGFSPGIFTSVMGVAGLGIAWRVGHQTVGLPSLIGETIIGLSFVLFAVLSVLYISKFVFFFGDAVLDFKDSARLKFLPALPMAGLLLSIGIRPYDFDLATYLWLASAPFNLIFALILVGRWVFESHNFEDMIPAWFFPIVGNAVVPIAGVPLGFHEASWPFFSVALVFWMVIFVILFQRLVFEKDLLDNLVPSVVILIAPPATIFIAYFELSGGSLDVLSRSLIYAALFLFALLFPYARKLATAPVSVAIWSLTFPLDALTIATFKFSVSSQSQWFEVGGVFVLTVTTVSVSLVALRSLAHLAKAFAGKSTG